MLDKDSIQQQHNKHYHEHYQLRYRLLKQEINQILDFGIAAIDVLLDQSEFNFFSFLNLIFSY